MITIINKEKFYDKKGIIVFSEEETNLLRIKTSEDDEYIQFEMYTSGKNKFPSKIFNLNKNAIGTFAESTKKESGKYIITDAAQKRKAKQILVISGEKYGISIELYASEKLLCKHKPYWSITLPQDVREKLCDSVLDLVETKSKGEKKQS